MKKSICIALFSVMLFLVACAPASEVETNPDQEIVSSEQQSEDASTAPDNSSEASDHSREESNFFTPTPNPSGEVPDSTPLQYPVNKKLPITLPDPIKPYQPEVNVVPLIGRGQVYGHYLMGELRFIDKDRNVISIPPAAVRYWINPTCYLLFDKDDNIALMRFDGTMATGFSYIALDGEDYRVCISFEQYVKVGKENGNKLKSGVVNLITGKELLPCEYDTIEFFDRVIHAVKDGKSMLIDYSGKLVYEFKEEVGFDSIFCSSSESDYYMDDENGLVVYAGKMAIGQYETYNYLYLNSKYTFTDKKWNPLFTIPDYTAIKFYFRTPKSVILGLESEIMVLTEDGNIVKYAFSLEKLGIPFNAKIYEYIREVEYQNKKLIFYLEDSSTKLKTFTRFVIDENNQIISKELGVKYASISNNNIAYQYYGEYALLDENGRELIPYSPYYLKKSGKFVLAELDYIGIGEGNYKAKIYDLNGKLLLEDIYGMPSELTLSNGAIVVYTSAQKCYLLTQDGKLMAVNDAGPVTRKYGNG